MKKIYILILFTITLTLVSCNKTKVNYNIVTTTFYEDDIVRNIVNDKLNTKSLLKPGEDLHDFRPTSKDMNHIKNANLFIFSGYKLNHWLNENVNAIKGVNTKSLDLSEYNDLNYNDLHFWTDPILFLNFINIIKDEIIKIDPSNSEYYINNANNYYNKILSLHNEFSNYLLNKDVTIYFAGHNSMYYFEKRYNIEINALSNTNKPDADLTSKQILELVNLIKSSNTKYLFIEELVSPKIANTIKNELKKDNYNLSLLLLHSYHNISKEDFNNGITYYDLYKQNILNIKKAVN